MAVSLILLRFINDLSRQICENVYMQEKRLGIYIHLRRRSLRPEVSLNAFAIENGIEPATLSRIENLKQDIKYATLEKVANGFKILPSQLILDYEAWKSSSNHSF